MQMSHNLGSIKLKFTKFLAVVAFSLTVLTQQSALRSVHPLSNERGNIKKEKKVTSVKHKPVGGMHRDAGRANYAATINEKCGGHVGPISLAQKVHFRAVITTEH